MLGVLFLMGGIIALFSAFVPPVPKSPIGVYIAGALAVCIGAACFPAPWQRWPRWSTLPLVALSFPLIAFYNYSVGVAPFRYSMYFILAYAFLGSAHRQWTPVAFLPLLLAAYLIPLVIRGQATPAALASGLLIVVVCLVVGESIAWITNRMRQAQIRLEDELRYRVGHDPLTNLDNRTLFSDRLEHAVTMAKRHSGSIAVLFIDLDDFKSVNDNLGHEAGDQILVEVGRRLLDCLRATDSVAGIGGDEFAIVIDDYDNPPSATVVAERILDALAAPHHLAGHTIVLGASIGIAENTPNTENVKALPRQADVAMYQAKEMARRSSYRIFQP